MKKNLNTQNNKAGIWIDHEHAYIFQLNKDYLYEMKTVYSRIAEKEDIQEGKKISRFRRLFINYARKQRRQHQYMLKFYEAIIQHLISCNHIYLFGPGNTKYELYNCIIKTQKKTGLRVLAIDAVDKIPPTQILEQVKNYFKSLRFEDSIRQLEHTTD
ncbi:MAG: hypothetical protein H7Y07_06055 [Pyrinomonadaceae bacterium]|nr:hypothetical protein [Sphingobacteriaceae bacterium]